MFNVYSLLSESKRCVIGTSESTDIHVKSMVLLGDIGTNSDITDSVLMNPNDSYWLEWEGLCRRIKTINIKVESLIFWTSSMNFWIGDMDVDTPADVYENA